MATQYSFAPEQFPLPNQLLFTDIFDLFESVVDAQKTREDVAAELTQIYKDNLEKPNVIDTIGNAIDYSLVDFSKVEKAIIDQFEKTDAEGQKDSNYTMEFDLVEQGVITAWAKQTTMISIPGTMNPTTPLVPPASFYSSFIPPPGWALISNTTITNTFSKGTIPRMPKIGLSNLQRNSYIISSRFTDLFTKHIEGIQIIYIGFLPPAPPVPFPPAPPFNSGNLTLL